MFQLPSDHLVKEEKTDYITISFIYVDVPKHFTGFGITEELNDLLLLSVTKSSH